MASFWKKYSKLSYEVLIDYSEIERKIENSSPRIMICLTDDYSNVVPISIDKSKPKFKIISDWIISNYEILMKHWNDEIDDEQAKDLLTKQ